MPLDVDKIEKDMKKIAITSNLFHKIMGDSLVYGLLFDRVSTAYPISSSIQGLRMYSPYTNEPFDETAIPKPLDTKELEYVTQLLYSKGIMPGNFTRRETYARGNDRVIVDTNHKSPDDLLKGSFIYLDDTTSSAILSSTDFGLGKRMLNPEEPGKMFREEADKTNTSPINIALGRDFIVSTSGGMHWLSCNHVIEALRKLRI